jgi:hypothetical protein
VQGLPFLPSAPSQAVKAITSPALIAIPLNSFRFIDPLLWVTKPLRKASQTVLSNTPLRKVSRSIFELRVVQSAFIGINSLAFTTAKPIENLGLGINGIPEQ